MSGGCTYKENPGTANIKTVEAAPSTGYNCPNSAQKVVFDFVPDTTSAVSTADHNVPLTVGAGMNPPEVCLQPNGISVGAKLPAIRKDILAGPCAPVSWVVTLSNAQLCMDKCWKN